MEHILNLLGREYIPIIWKSNMKQSSVMCMIELALRLENSQKNNLLYKQNKFSNYMGRILEQTFKQKFF